MFNRDPKCVFVASDVGQATVLANWLEHEGIRTQVMDPMTHGGLDGLTAWTGVSARGIEVWAIMPADVDRAEFADCAAACSAERSCLQRKQRQVTLKFTATSVGKYPNFPATSEVLYRTSGTAEATSMFLTAIITVMMTTRNCTAGRLTLNAKAQRDDRRRTVWSRNCADLKEADYHPFLCLCHHIDTMENLNSDHARFQSHAIARCAW